MPNAVEKRKRIPLRLDRVYRAHQIIQIKSGTEVWAHLRATIFTWPDGWRCVDTEREVWYTEQDVWWDRDNKTFTEGMHEIEMDHPAKAALSHMWGFRLPKNKSHIDYILVRNDSLIWHKDRSGLHIEEPRKLL